MKFIVSEIQFSKIEILGFDMDGTLYDEFDFIKQVYFEIAKMFAKEKDCIEVDVVFESMINIWLEKGSSYPYIFSEVLTDLGFDENHKSQIIDDALKIFRNFKPTLTLSARMRFVLTNLKMTKQLFLISDGSSTLQWNKIVALGLLDYFKKENIFISGDYPSGFGKPSLHSLNFINIFQGNVDSKNVIYIGDRKVDQDFALSAGFHFFYQDSINDIFRQINKN